MNERNINVNYNDAIRQAKKLESIAKALKKQVRNAENYINDLQNNWKGDNAKKFCAKVNESKKQLNNNANNLDDIASAMRISAAKYKEAELQKLADENEE